MDVQKESLNINKLVAEKREIIFAEGDMIVPDSKPDILNTICTSGVVSIYKKETYEGKIRIDGGVNTYIMYLPDNGEENIRGLNTTIDFSEIINVSNSKEGTDVICNAKIKSIEAKVLNGRKISIKITLEVDLKEYISENIDIVNEIQNCDEIQILKENLNINSLVGKGNTKIYLKENIPIDAGDNIAEILEFQVNLVDNDIKMSYNKVLTKSESEIKIMYLTEDNRINVVTYKIPVVGFIDIPNVTDGNLCDVNYEIKNIILKLNSQEEHSIYIEMEIEVMCNVYEEKQINLIQDMYSPVRKIEFEKKSILTMTDKSNVRNIKQIREKINVEDITGMSLIDVDIIVNITNESKINSKILYEGELNLKLFFENSNNQIIIKDAKIPFEYTIDNLQNGELLNTNNEITIKTKDFIIQDGGNINCNIDFQTETDLYKNATISVIDSIEESQDIEEQDYSIIIYIVKKGDTLWNIAKKYGSTVDGILKINDIENKDLIMPGQKIYIPKFESVLEVNYE